jgi:acyl-CoA synthetase (AMP-forming)/AMP-acid ligase II
VTSDENVYPAEVESVMTGHPAVVPHPGPQVSPQTKGVPKSDRCRC